MKKLILIILTGLLVGCGHYETLVKENIDLYGINADSTNILLERGLPRRYYFTKEDFEYQKIMADQFFLYREKNTPDRPLTLQHEIDTLYLFNDGELKLEETWRLIE